MSLGVLCWPDFAHADVRIEVQFTTVQTGPFPRLRPTSVGMREVVDVLHGKNEVTRNFNDAAHTEIAGGGRANFSDIYGVKSVIYFRNGMIEERVAYPHYVIVTQIKTDGRSACSVTKTVRRAPGYRYFDRTPRPGKCGPQSTTSKTWPARLRASDPLRALSLAPRLA